MKRSWTACYLIGAAIFLTLWYLGYVTVGAQAPPPDASVLVRYTGLSWAGNALPVKLPYIAVSRSAPACLLTATEQQTLTCAPFWAVNAVTNLGVDDVIVHLTSAGHTEAYKTVGGGLIQFKVRQGQLYTIRIEQPAGYRIVPRTTLDGQPFRQGSATKGNKTSDLLVLQLWPK